MRGPERWASIGFAVALLAAGPLTMAQPSDDGDAPIAFTWDAPSTCPSSAAVIAESHRLLGGDTGGSRRVRGVATVSETAEGWQLVLETRVDGVEGRRELRAATCQQVADAAALILALAFDPARVGIVAPDPVPDEPPPRPPPPPEPAPQREPKPPPPEPTLEPAESDATSGDDDEAWLGGSVALLATGDIGSLVGPAIGIGGAAGLRLAMIRIEAGGRYWFPQQERIDSSGAGGAFDFATGYLQAGPGLRWSRLRLVGMAGVELGSLRAQGINVDRQQTASLLWVAARVGGAFTVTLASPLALRVDLGLAIPFDRPRWVLDDIGVVDRPAPVVGRLGGGLEATF